MDGNIEKSSPRGSEWCRWEPHIHAPGTVLAGRFTETDAWELFPNIELRLNTGTVKGNFVNVHLLVSPEDPNHIAELNRFLAQLFFLAFSDKFVCTQSDLIRLGRRADPTKTDEAALRHGCTQFKVSRENLMDAWRGMDWARKNILIAVAGNADGTSGIRDAADATLREEIEAAAHVIFASSPKQRDFWLGHAAAPLTELRDRYGGPKPCLWGCDAHHLAHVAKPAEDRLCWIKGTPTFDALRQACIDPEHAFVGLSPPILGAASQIIDEVVIDNAPWLQTPSLKLNPGLVAIIGARGSGKTALADTVAAGCDSYYESSERPSFLARAREYLGGARVTLKWLSGGDPMARSLDSPVNRSPEAYPRARYLSQQFVEELCSIRGMPALIKEVERVIFEAHSSMDRDGTVDFQELLEHRADRYREARNLEEAALANLSDQIGIEMEKTTQVATLTAQIAEKQNLLARYEDDRKALFPKGDNKIAERLQVLISAAEKVRSILRALANQQASLTGLKTEVADLRQNRAPAALRSMKERHQQIRLETSEWDRFLLRFSGDVDGTVAGKAIEVEKRIQSWKGVTSTTPDHSGAFLSETADPERTPLAVLEAEIARLEKLVTADQETARKLAAVSKRIAEEAIALERLREKLADCESARERAVVLAAEREQGYVRVFDAVLGEERVLKDLYVPLMNRMQANGGTLAKLSFTVRRVADVNAWATRGEEDLFDLRRGPFRGIGSLAKVAAEMLVEAWETGDSAAAAAAMANFRETYQNTLLEKAPYPRSDPSNYRPWSRRFAQWLYSTSHISIEYGITYDDIEIRKLSPGTRGIVLVLLYLALDDADDRPLIIDQPEENLDPKSIYDELVPLFQTAKRNRQVIIVTHNANLVVNTDADQIIVAEVGAHTSAGLPPISYRSGGLDQASTRKMVCNILEGGEQAFLDRARRLHILLER